MSTSPSIPPEVTTAVPAELRQRLRLLRKRYGRRSISTPRDQLSTAVSRRRYPLFEVRKQSVELEQRVKTIEAELEGFGKGMAALVIDEIAGYERDFPEAWSPTAVLGFRIWTIENNELVGARFVWEMPVFEATCEGNPASEEVPHTDERCGRLGCGVYATKRLADLLGEHVHESTRDYAAGLVALGGKVVEHEDGYRAARAEVVSVTLIGRDREVMTSDPGVITTVFADPGDALSADSSRVLAGPILPRIHEHLMQRKDQPWI